MFNPSVHPSIHYLHSTAIVGLFCKPSEFKLIWNRCQKRANKAAIPACALTCSRSTATTSRERNKGLYWKYGHLGFKLEWGWKSRLECLLLHLHCSSKFHFGFQFHFQQNTFGVILNCSLFFTYSLPKKKKRENISASCNTLCQVHLAAHNFLIADGVLVSRQDE